MRKIFLLMLLSASVVMAENKVSNEPISNTETISLKSLLSQPQSSNLRIFGDFHFYACLARCENERSDCLNDGWDSTAPCDGPRDFCRDMCLFQFGY
ncbi:hypothetical protein [Marinicella sp. W31]|uniref:hypothetical protein n=1 Tax=Marinicella sp. W31 TaxID=3023713 RepID=UPI0037572057